MLSVVDGFWLAVVIAACAVLVWLGARIEPHWVSKDGKRFMCNGQRVTAHGSAESRWRETRVTINNAHQVQIDERHLLGRRSTFWTVVSRSEDARRGREVFVLSGIDDSRRPCWLALRIPKASRAVVELDQLLHAEPPVRPSSPDRGSG